MANFLRIQVGDGPIIQAEEAYGVYLTEGDIRLPLPIRNYEVQEYPETTAVDIYPVTKFEPFDYTVKLCCVAKGSDDVNSVIQQLQSLFLTPSGGMMRANVISIYDDYRHTKMVGYYKSIASTEFGRTESESFLYFDLTIYVSDPSKCEINTN